MGQKIHFEKWEQIRLEYVSSNISIRDLAKEHSIGESTIWRRAKREGWLKQREDLTIKVLQKSEEELIGKKYQMYDKAYTVTQMILSKIEQNIEGFGDDPIPGSEMKAYTGAIKDIREMGFFRSDLDRAEQEARIRKLQKECEEEKKDVNITVTFEEDDYGD